MLHANALLYAADCTVSLAMHSYTIVRTRNKTTKQRTVAIVRGAGFHVARCTALLITTSCFSALGTLAKPGLGTKVRVRLGL